MPTNYPGHDQVYQRLRADGAWGWTSEADYRQVVQPRVQQVLGQDAILPGSSVLDWGCGTGAVAIGLAQQGYIAHGIDIAPTAIAWARERAAAQQVAVQFAVGNVVAALPYPDATFRLIADGRCLHCLIGADRAAALREVARVLQPGGCFLVQAMCGPVLPASPCWRDFDPASRCTISASGVATRYIGEPEALRQELQVAGLQADDWEIVPRQSEDDQDDLIVRARKR